MRDVRSAVGDGGLFLIYEPVCHEGESRPAYLDRFEQTNHSTWAALTPEEWLPFWRTSAPRTSPSLRPCGLSWAATPDSPTCVTFLRTRPVGTRYFASGREKLGNRWRRGAK
jgi:hypothetical protein